MEANDMPAATKQRPAPRGRDESAEDRRFLDKHGDKLSPSTHRAKWLHSPEEGADRNGQTLATRSHEVIRAWARRRHANPATVRSRKSEQPRVLRFDFDAQGEEPNPRLKPISWDAFFEVFDKRELVMLFQERLKNGNVSNFARFDSPYTEG
jgi:hypothetical protein